VAQPASTDTAQKSAQTANIDLARPTDPTDVMFCIPLKILH
jgi:hypothetical protein